MSQNCGPVHYIPGHGTPTVILFGRNRAPVASVIRTVRGVRGEPSAPDDPALGLVWSAIVAQTDQANSASAFISTEDTAREALARHPWNMGGGGAAEVQEAIEGENDKLSGLGATIGFFAITGEDDAYLLPASARIRSPYPQTFLGVGDEVRDYAHTAGTRIVFPYSTDSDATCTGPQF